MYTYDHEGGTLVQNWRSDSYFWMFNLRLGLWPQTNWQQNFPNCKDTNKRIHTEILLLLINLCSPFLPKQHQLIFESLAMQRDSTLWMLIFLLFRFGYKSGDIAHAEPDEMQQHYVVFNRNLFSIGIIHKRLSAHFIRLYFCCCWEV